jgi:hypothetical protein
VGPADLIDEDGAIVWRDATLPPSPLRAIGWASTLDAVHLFGGSRHHHANLGMFRRSVITAHGLSIPHTAGETGISVRALLFAVALRGRIQYQPGYLSRRCVHPRSYTARHGDRRATDQWRRARSYWHIGRESWRAAFTSVSARALAPPLLGAATVHLVARRALERISPRVRLISAQQRAPTLPAE